MLNLSLAGLVGAALGTVVAALAYRPVVGFLVRNLQAQARDAEDENALERGMPVLLRAVLALDIIVFAGAGYWVGASLVG